MANEQTSVPLYAASEVLTAANMNISAGTGVPVFATTVTRDAAFGGANEKVLAEGQLCYLSSTNVVQYYDGAAWATVGPAAASGLTLISTTTIGSAVSSVTVSSVFSSTYANYRVIISNTTTSAQNNIGITFSGSAGSTYSSALNYTAFGAGSAVETEAATTKIKIGVMSTNLTPTMAISGDILSANLAAPTQIFLQASSTGYGTRTEGFDSASTAHTGFTITPTTGTLTAGTIKVYGYQNS